MHLRVSDWYNLANILAGVELSAVHSINMQATCRKRAIHKSRRVSRTKPCDMTTRIGLYGVGGGPPKWVAKRITKRTKGGQGR